MSKKRRPSAEHTSINDPMFQRDPMRRQTPEPNVWQPYPFATAVSAPTDLQPLLDLIEAEIARIGSAGGLDAGTWTFQDQYISSLLAPWRAGRFEQYQRRVHTAEDLNHQADANVSETKQHALHLAERIVELRTSIRSAYALVAGLEIAEADREKARKELDVLVAAPSAATVSRIGMTDVVTGVARPLEEKIVNVLHLVTPEISTSGLEPATNKETAK